MKLFNIAFTPKGLNPFNIHLAPDVNYGAGGTGVNKKVMLVEDDAFDYQMVKRALGLLKYDLELEWQQESWIAIDKLKESKQADLPSMIFLDLKMPRVDGFEFLRELKAHKTLQDIKVIVISTSSDPDDKSKALNLGARDYIVKTFDFSEFVEQFRRLNISDAD